MASPDTIILLTVDYHAAIGGHKSRAPPPRLAYALWLNPTPIYWTIYSPDLYLYRCCIGLGVYLLPYFYYVMLTYMPRKSFPVWMNEWLNASASTFYSSSTFWLYSAVPVVNKYFPPFLITFLLMFWYLRFLGFFLVKNRLKFQGWNAPNAFDGGAVERPPLESTWWLRDYA